MREQQGDAAKGHMSMFLQLTRIRLAVRTRGPQQAEQNPALMGSAAVQFRKRKAVSRAPCRRWPGARPGWRTRWVRPRCLRCGPHRGSSSAGCRPARGCSRRPEVTYDRESEEQSMQTKAHQRKPTDLYGQQMMVQSIGA